MSAQFVHYFGSLAMCTMSLPLDHSHKHSDLREESGGRGEFPALRVVITGLFMGLANLVPGVSGGTMVLALGLYEDFIQAVSDLTRMQLNRRSLLFLVVLGGVAVMTIFSLAGFFQYLMEFHLSFMLALFVGMTLGGTPILYRRLKSFDISSFLCAVAGFALMAVIVFLLKPDQAEPSWFLFFMGGLVGSVAMILPGISGSYMMLIMGLYLPIITAISDWKDSIRALDVSSIISTGLIVILPISLGLIGGVALLANVLKYLLDRFHRQTIGFLIGLLLGSVMGLYPFKATDVSRMVRYSEEVSGRWALSIQAHGLDQAGGRQVTSNLKELGTGGMQVDISHYPASEPITMAMLDEAAGRRAVMIVYNMEIEKSLRQIAHHDPAFDLVFIPDTRISPTRAVICILLLFFGVFITVSIGHIRRKT